MNGNNELSSTSLEVEVPADVREVDARLHELGAAERAAAGPGFEDRVQLRTAGYLRMSEAGEHREDGGPGVIVLHRWRSVMRFAAVLVVAASAFGLYLAIQARRTSGTTEPQMSGGASVLVNNLSSDLDAWLSEDSDPLDETLDALFAQTSLLGETIDSDWLSTDSLDKEEI